MSIFNEERNTYIAVAIVIITLGFCLLYTSREDLKKEYYSKGLQAGQEYSEYYRYKFNDDEYIGSLKWIEKHDLKLFNDIKSRGTDYNDEFPLGL